MMDKKIKAKWIKALRSGDFNRATATLCEVRKNGQTAFCCLGVLAHIASPNPWRKHEGEYTFNGNCNNTGLLDGSFQATVGITDEEQDTLAAMNDDGLSFKKLARYIEKNL
jgi:hypothetical protein